ncbi:hypothetical protein FACS1894159_01140 [Bacteroidia bacterium]|nr:hypothetical protein FACS1894159_01140 [Bacteroidia bacterium]
MTAEEYFNKGYEFASNGDFNSAIENYSKAIEIDPTDAMAYNNRGNAKSDLGDKEAAIEDYDKAIEINPNLAEAYNNRGVAKSDLGDHRAAIEDYDKAIEINPNYAEAYNNRGVAKSDLGDYQAAIEDYDKAIEINPNYAEAYNNRGVAKSDLGDKQAAIDDYSKAIEINPNLAEAYNNRGNAKSDLGDRRAAIEDYDKAIEINPNFAEAYCGRGVAKSDLGDYQAAIEDYDKAIEINPNFAEAYCGRGAAKSDLGEQNEAIQDYCTVLYLLTEPGKRHNPNENRMLRDICSKLTAYPQNIVYAYENGDFNPDNATLETAYSETADFYLYLEYLQKQEIPNCDLMSIQAAVYYHLGGNVQAFRIYNQLNINFMSAQEAYCYALTANETGYRDATDILDNAIGHIRNKADKTDEDHYYLGQLYMLDEDQVAAKEEFERSKNFPFSRIMHGYLSNNEPDSDYFPGLKLSGTINIEEYALSQFQDYFHCQECLHYMDLTLPTGDFEKLFWKAFTLGAANINAIYESLGKNRAASIKQDLIAQLQNIKNGYSDGEAQEFKKKINKNSSASREGLENFIVNRRTYGTTPEEELALHIYENKTDQEQLIVNIVYSFLTGEITSEQYMDLMYYFRHRQLEQYNKALNKLFKSAITLIPNSDTAFDLIDIAVSLYELFGQHNYSGSILPSTGAQDDYQLFRANEWKQILVDHNAKNRDGAVELSDFIPVYNGTQTI